MSWENRGPKVAVKWETVLIAEEIFTAIANFNENSGTSGITTVLEENQALSYTMLKHKRFRTYWMLD